MARPTGSPPAIIGRNAEAERFRRLQATGARLITVVGPPGIGKTAFVRSVADASWPFVQLEGVTDAAELGRRVMASLLDAPAVTERAGAEAASEAGRMLAVRAISHLVLDGLERLESAPAVVAGWLGAAPGLHLIVASRHVLGVAGEQVLELGPLDPAPATELVEATVSACVPGFPEDATARAVAAGIARALEGHPLAIVVAAARTRLMTPAELRTRLSAPQDAAGHRPIEPVLEEAIEDSYRLLAPVERQALLALASLDAPVPLDVAETLILPGEGRSALDLLQALRDRSLVTIRRDGPEGSRVAVDGSIRRYARGRPEYAAVNERTETRYIQQLLGGESSPGAARDAEISASLAVAPTRLLRRLLAQDRSEGFPATETVGLVSWLGNRSVNRTVTPDEIVLVEQALERLDTDGLRIPRVLVAYGRLLNATGRHDDALAAYRAALRIPRPSDLERAAAHEALGEALARALRNAEAARELERARTAYQAVGDSAGAGRITCRLAAVAQTSGDPDRAQLWYREAIATARRAGELESIAHGEGGLGALALERESYEAAVGHYETALALLRSTSATRLAALHHGYLGIALFGLGDPEKARTHLDRCVDGCREIGHLLAFAVFRAVRGATLANLDRIAEAERELAGAFQAAAGDDLGLALVDLWAGHLELARGRAAASAGEGAGARSAARDVAGRVAAARRAPGGAPSSPGQPEALVARSDDARIALSLLLAALADFEGRHAAPTGEPSADHTLEVGLDGTWFRLGGAEVVDLGRKRVAIRLLLALTHYAGGPERSVAGATLVEEVWPGERLSARTSGRLYVAINQLRQLGLDEVLVRDDRGYRLHARVLFRAGPVD